ncbi:acyltransferase family protein [Microvirga guangxiensis]|uniref:Fucose 4-O-acetylase n=1 Tax=Microvirga guangxiensis TaxID=549386 RepID=A0A1G5HRL3_9HYPH|nr:acyltransferase [Microvirga guangxiensis]SCY66436.1 Fucose 4-O-acetylase [Microvirga guangxiensis]
MEERHRDAINFLRLLLVIGLVFLHYGNFPGSVASPFDGFSGFHKEHALATFVNIYFVYLFYSSVPLLGTISGYLFFRNWKPGMDFYWKRIKSRTFSILLPMISWCAIVLAVFYVIRMFSPTSGFLALIDNYDLDNLGLRQLVNALAGITRRPVNFQFWFLRDLFLTVLCTPLLGLLIRRIPYIGLAAIGLVWLFNVDVPVFFRNDVFFFFYLGGLIQARGWNLDFIPPRAAVVAMVVYLIVVGLRTVAPAFVTEDTAFGYVVLEPMTRLMRLLGVYAFWGCAPFLMRTFIGRQIVTWGALAFFLHAIHWPLNHFVKDGLAALLPPEGDAGLIMNYFGTTFVTIAISFAAAWLLNKTLPSLFSHLSGGREFNAPQHRNLSPAAVSSPQNSVASP